MKISKLQILILTIGIMQFNLSYSITKASDLEAGAKLFLIKEIRQRHKTADLSSIEVKILNPETIKDKFCYNHISYYLPIYSNLHKKTTIVAECKDQRPWKIYLPVSVKFLAKVISVKKSLPKLHVINPDDLIQKKINVITLKDPYFADLNEVVGLVLKNSIKQDTVLTANLLEKVEHGA